MPTALLRLLAIALCAFAAPALSAPPSDAQIIEEATLAFAGDRIEIHAHDATPGRPLLVAAEAALAAMERVLGRTLDTATLGPKLRIYVSGATKVSHVWRGYEHPGDPRGVLFLNPRVARLAVEGSNATYAHELAHLLTWRFHSHTLREGLADYLALQVHPGAGLGPNPQGYADPPAVPEEIAQLLGTTRPPPAAVSEDPAFRAAYYYASYRLVHYLVARDDMERFLQLYDAPDPERAIERLYGLTREAAVRAALAQVPASSGPA